MDCQEIFRDLVYRVEPEWAPALYRDDYYPTYYGFGRSAAPRLILEIGTRFGYSLIALCRGAIDAGVVPSFVSIDLDSYPIFFGTPTQAVARANIKACVPEALGTLIRADSHGILPGLRGDFDLVHVDGDHSEAGAYQDIRDSYLVVKPGGLILVDDLDQEPVRKAFERASRNLKFAEVSEVPHLHRLGVLVKPVPAVVC